MAANAADQRLALRGVLVRSVAGGFGDASGSSRGLSCPRDLEWLLSQRDWAEAVVVSYGTALREHYPTAWRQRPVIVISEDSSRREHARSLGFAVSDLAGLPQVINESRMERVVCEGGPRLVDRIAGLGWLGELALTTSPVLAPPDVLTPQLDDWIAEATRKWSETTDGFVYELLTSGDRADTENR